MAFSFSIYIYPGTDLNKVFKRLKEDAARSSLKIAFNGTTTSGSISGAIEASYRLDGEEMHVTVSKKPMFATEDMVKDELKRYF